MGSLLSGQTVNIFMLLRCDHVKMVPVLYQLKVVQVENRHLVILGLNVNPYLVPFAWFFFMMRRPFWWSLFPFPSSIRSYGFPMDSYSCPLFSGGFPIVFFWIPMDFDAFLWVSNRFLWLSYSFLLLSMICYSLFIVIGDLQCCFDCCWFSMIFYGNWLFLKWCNWFAIYLS